jgi:hypothetical protein
VKESNLPTGLTQSATPQSTTLLHSYVKRGWFGETISPVEMTRIELVTSCAAVETTRL